MVPFAYAQVASVAAATASFARHRSDGAQEQGADFLAGGTDMVQLMGEHLRNPDRVIDISALPELDRIEPRADSLRLGALARMSDVAAHPAVRAECPVVSEALLASASAQVRNLATLGGNLLQRTRCGYFRDPGAPCEKREPGTGCPAITGQNRFHAVLGGSEHCIATYAGDFANALLVLDAAVRIAGPNGERTIPLADLHCVPGDTPAVETQLAPGELILSIDVPTGPAARRSHYLKVRDRASFEWSIASAAVALDLGEGGTVRNVRIAVGGVATKPWRLPQVEAALRGERLTPALSQEAAAHAADGAVPRGRNAYKVELIRRTVARAGRDGSARMNAIGAPLTRVDGPAKVTGGARYAAEFHPDGLVYAATHDSTVPAGRVTAIDTAAAERAPGVLLVLTHLNADRLPYQTAAERPAVDPVAGEQVVDNGDAALTVFDGQ